MLVTSLAEVVWLVVPEEVAVDVVMVFTAATGATFTADEKKPGSISIEPGIFVMGCG